MTDSAPPRPGPGKDGPPEAGLDGSDRPADRRPPTPSAPLSLSLAPVPTNQGEALLGYEITALAHEIRSPLAAVIGHLDLLRHEREADAELTERLSLVQNNARYLLELAESLLACAKAGDGRLVQKREVFSPAGVANEVIGSLQPTAQAKGLALRADLSPDLPRRVLGNPVVVRQVLTNLAANALRFTREGGVRLVIDASPTAPAGGPVAERGWVLRFAVQDTGIGMAADQVGLLWHPFTQVHAEDQARGGHGLGLWICRRLVQALGGSISVASMPGMGSAFRVELPVAAHAPAEPSPSSRVTASPLAHELAGLRVLVVDDVPTNQLLISALLKHRGSSVTLAADGAEGLERAIAACDAGMAFDLIIMDIHMPEMDGHEASARLRAYGYRGPIVACSAAYERQGVGPVFDAWIEKPFDFDSFVRTLVQAVQRRREG